MKKAMPTLVHIISVAAACPLCFGFVFVAAADQKSLWAYNDSVMYLVAKGQVREFRYQEPRPALIPFGVTSGTLAFRGVFRDGQYVGTAFKFTREYGALSFRRAAPSLITANGFYWRGSSRKSMLGARTLAPSIKSSNFDWSRSSMKCRIPSSQPEVPLKKVGGTFVVPVEINEAITLDFTIDSGAADVSVPLDVFSTLSRKGTIEESEHYWQTNIRLS